ncbi:uncharacterized protein LOC143554369 [Bidens hawaiensis]|uniref:uncharacterized protein LOC143554369 n=1 Tax=Bidens hawaiensis TaxID=980011 RepID=UPI004049EFA3
MSRHTYVTKGYSNYNDQEGGYAYGPEARANWYVVETTTVERVRAPTTSYVKYGVVPMRHEGLKEYMPTHATKNHHEGHGLNYGSSYEKSSSAHYHEMENLMANFLDKIQIEASRPTNKFITTSSNNYLHTSSNNYQSTSSNRYRHTSPNRYHPTSPNRYRPTSPDRYRPTSPDRYHHTSPDMYRHTSPNRYTHTSRDMYNHTSPDKYRDTSPNKYNHTSSDKYHHTSLDKYRHTSPYKYNHTSPAKHRYTSPTHNFPTKGKPIRAQRLSSPNEHHTSSLGTEGSQHIRMGNHLGENNHWHSAQLHTTHNPLVTPAHDIDEATSFLVESMNNLKWANPNKVGVDNLSPHGQSYEQERHTRHAFGGAKIRRLLVKKP